MIRPTWHLAPVWGMDIKEIVTWMSSCARCSRCCSCSSSALLRSGSRHCQGRFDLRGLAKLGMRGLPCFSIFLLADLRQVNADAPLLEGLYHSDESALVS